MKRRYGSIAAAVLSVVSTAALGQAAPASQLYSAVLAPMNNSGAAALATVGLSGDQLTVMMAAERLEGGMEHAAHIHFGADQGAGACPTLADDQDADNLISLEETEAVIGAPLVPLNALAVGEGGAGQLVQTVALSPQALQTLQGEGRATLVVHGLTVQGSAQPTLPIACGELRLVGAEQEQEQEQQQEQQGEGAQ